LGWLLLLEIGRRVRVRRRPKESEGEQSGLSTVEGAVFALFGLMMAFTFSGAASRLAEKRMLIADEVNCIETAYLRLHLLSQQAQPALRNCFALRGLAAGNLSQASGYGGCKMEMANSKKIQEETWTAAVAATSLPDSRPFGGLLLLPAINNMIDISTTRTMALQSHPPRIIYVLLFGLGLVCSLLAGYRMASGQHRSWLHILGFTGLTSSLSTSCLTSSTHARA